MIESDHGSFRLWSSFACLTLCAGCLVRKRSFVHTAWTKKTSVMFLGDDTMGTFHVRSLRTRLTRNIPGWTSVDDSTCVSVRVGYMYRDGSLQQLRCLVCGRGMHFTSVLVTIESTHIGAAHTRICSPKLMLFRFDSNKRDHIHLYIVHM